MERSSSFPPPPPRVPAPSQMEPSPSSSSTPSPSSWDPGKLFVGGISWDTGESALREHFEKYGEVAEAVSVKDRTTGNPRGFAFVLFSNPDSVERALNDKDRHSILGRTVEVKRARPRSGQYQNQNQNQNKGINKISANVNASNWNSTRSKKIFVGGLSSDVTADVFQAYFEKFGKVTDVVVIYDSTTQRSRGFGFVEFDKEEAVDKVLRKSHHELNNKVVEVKIAVPKDGHHYRNNGNSNSNGGNYSSRAGDGGGYGFENYQGGFHPTYGPRYGYPYVYVPPAIPGYAYGAAGYGGGYAYSGYGRFSYGAPFVSPRMPWNDQGLVNARQNPVPYGTGAVYPGYPNGGFGGYLTMPAGGYNEAVSSNDKWNQTGSDVQTTSISDAITSRVESLKLDAR